VERHTYFQLPVTFHTEQITQAIPVGKIVKKQSEGVCLFGTQNTVP